MLVSIGEEEVSLYLVPTLAMCMMAMSGTSSTLLCSIFLQHRCLSWLLLMLTGFNRSLILNILLVLFILLYRIYHAMRDSKRRTLYLLGVIPGPKEPELVMNSYLSPLVEDLKIGWNSGFSLLTPQRISVNVRLALTCVACDIPASRKVNGFLGHHASLGCNKCLKKFSVTFGNQPIILALKGVHGSFELVFHIVETV